MSQLPISPGRVLAAGVAAVVLSVLGVADALAAPSPHRGLPRPLMQQTLERLVRDDRYPAALAAVQDRRGHGRTLSAGVADLRSRARVPLSGRVRVGSNTKTFTAVVVLQLVGEGKIRLDAPVETYLPGLLRDKGGDGRRITVRQLLQHTSGLPNYTSFLSDGLLPFQHTYFQPRRLLDMGLERTARSAPGTAWEYSNTNYVVAGLLIEAVTGRPVAEAITERVTERIGLRRTSFPNVGDERIRGPHPRAYHTDDPSRPLVDVSEMDPSFGWAAGQMISTPSELNRFFTALLDGRLLQPRQLKQMRTTVAAPGLQDGARYGLGLISTPLRCGGLAWGHGGDITGFSTTNAATDDGRAAALAVTRLPASAAAPLSLRRPEPGGTAAARRAAACPRRGGSPARCDRQRR